MPERSLSASFAKLVIVDAREAVDSFIFSTALNPSSPILVMAAPNARAATPTLANDMLLMACCILTADFCVKVFAFSRSRLYLSVFARTDIKTLPSLAISFALCNFKSHNFIPCNLDQIKTKKPIIFMHSNHFHDSKWINIFY